jgi:hypothetical protein
MASFDGGDSLQQATKLAPLRFASKGSLSGADGVMEAGESVEWFQIKAKGRSSSQVKVTLSAAPDINQTIEVYYRAPNRTQGKGKRIATIAGGIDRRDVKALPGTYFFKVSQNPGTVADGKVYLFDLVSVNLNAFKAASKSGSSRSTQSNELFF